MKLRVYLAEKEMTAKEFSEKAGIHRNYLGLIINGKIKPGKRLARDLEILTEGKVRFLEQKPELVTDVQKKTTEETQQQQ